MFKYLATIQRDKIQTIVYLDGTDDVIKFFAYMKQVEPEFRLVTMRPINELHNIRTFKDIINTLKKNTDLLFGKEKNNDKRK